MVNIDEARSYMKDFQEGKFVPSISFMFESQRGFTGIDNSHHEFIVRTFESEGDCINWLESTSDRLTEKLSVDLPPLREWMTIKNLQDADLISGNTKHHAGIRNQLYKGENLNAKLVKTVYNPNIDAMTFIFKTPATLKAHEPGYQPLIVDPHANFIKKANPSHNYTMMIQVLDFVKWLRETRPSNITTPITWKEIKDVLDVAYVKVWCNCLRGTTLIKLLDGRTVSVKDLAEEFKTNKDLWVYSTDEHGNFKPGKINDVAITGATTEFVRVTLDNGKQIETTEDHLYMMRDGSYKAACELQVGESLMPLYFDDKRNNGYERVKHNYGDFGYHSVYKEVATEVFSESQFQEAMNRDPNGACAIHHIDYNKSNNNPSNLRIMGRLEHYRFHSDFVADRHKNDPEFSRKQREGASKFLKNLNAHPTEAMRNHRKEFVQSGPAWVHANPDLHKQLTTEGVHKYWEEHPEANAIRSEAVSDFYNTESGEQKKKNLSESMSARWADAEKRQQIMESLKHQKPRPVGSGLNSSLAARAKLAAMSQEERDLRYKNKMATTYKRLADSMKAQGIELSWENMSHFDCKHTRKLSEHFESFDDMLEYIGYKNYNHKIAKIEYITVEEEPLYDISVDKWNNFYVDAGVVLHNCSSFHWFGKNYRATQFDCSLYPTNIPDKQMRGRFGEYDILCKHLGNMLKNQSIQFFLPQMASAAQKILKSRNLV